MKDYSFRVEVLVDANPSTNHPMMPQEWQRELRRLAGERLLSDLEGNTTPFTVETSYRHQPTDRAHEVKVVLEVKARFANGSSPKD